MIVATAAYIFGKWIRPSELRALLVDQRIWNFAGPWLAVFVATKDEGGHDTASILNVSGHAPQHAGVLSATTCMGVARLAAAKEPECFMATPVAFGLRNVPEKGGPICSDRQKPKPHLFRGPWSLSVPCRRHQ